MLFSFLYYHLHWTACRQKDSKYIVLVRPFAMELSSEVNRIHMFTAGLGLGKIPKADSSMKVRKVNSIKVSHLP